MPQRQADSNSSSARTTYRGVARREQILRSATEMFIAHGYASVSLDAIVREVGGSKTNVYSQFGSKEGLFAAVVEAECAELLKRFKAMDIVNMPVAEGLKTLGRQLLAVLLNERHIAFQRMVISETGRFPELGRVWFANGPQQSREVIARFLRARQIKDELRAGDMSLAATFFHDTITFNPNLYAMLGMSPTPGEIDHYLSQAVESFLTGHAMTAHSRP